MTVSDALQGVSLLGLDTSPIIYFVELHPKYHPVCEAVFRAIDAGTPQAVTSILSLTETLVKPLLTGNTVLVQAFEALLTPSEHLAVIPLSAPIGRQAAELRVRYNLRMADALQISAALSAGCDAFLTGDKDLRRVAETKILVVDDLTV